MSINGVKDNKRVIFIRDVEDQETACRTGPAIPSLADLLSLQVGECSALKARHVR